jgi:hypothetical protein
MVNPVSSQAAPVNRPQDNEPKNEAPRAAASEPTNFQPDNNNTSGGPQPTPGGTNVTTHPGAPGAGGGAINNPASDGGFKDNGSATSIGA